MSGYKGSRILSKGPSSVVTFSLIFIWYKLLVVPLITHVYSVSIFGAHLTCRSVSPAMTLASVSSTIKLWIVAQSSEVMFDGVALMTIRLGDLDKDGFLLNTRLTVTLWPNDTVDFVVFWCSNCFSNESSSDYISS